MGTFPDLFFRIFYGKTIQESCFGKLLAKILHAYVSLVYKNMRISCGMLSESQVFSLFLPIIQMKKPYMIDSFYKIVPSCV